MGLGRVIPSASALFGAGLVAFAFSRTLWLSCPLLLVAGFGFMVQNASSNTVIQTIVDDAKRGRVMSFYMMAFLGTAPFGSLLAGSLSARIGAPDTLAIGGVCCVAGARVVRERPAGAARAGAADLHRDGHPAAGGAGLEDAAELSVPPEQP